MLKNEKILFYLSSLLILLLPFYLLRFNVLGIPSTFLEISIYLVFLTFVAWFFINKKNITLKKLIFSLLLLFISIIDSCLALDKNSSFGQTKAFFFDGLLVVILIQILFENYKENFFNYIFKSYLFVSVILAIWGILQKLGLVGLFGHQKVDPMLANQLSQGRILGPFESPNYLAMFILPAAIMLFVNYFENYIKFKKEWFYIIFSILIIALFFTQSIASLLTLLITVVIYCYLKLPKLKYLVVTALLFFVLALSALIVSGRIDKIDSAKSRIEIYKAGINIGSKHNFFGIGLGNFNSYYGEYIKSVPNRMNWEALHPHNLFLNFWVSMGLPGLFVFIIMVCLIFNKKNFQNKKIFIFPLIAILFNGLLDTAFFKNDLAIIFWLFYALLI